MYGLAAYGLYRLVVHVGGSFFDWDRGGRWVAGAAIAAAGIYELTPLKSVCLRHCRSPMHYVLGHWRQGRVGAVRMGAEHGAYCVGCCWGLMIVLFALGVMSLTWMAVVAGADLRPEGASARRGADEAVRGAADRHRDLGRRRSRQRPWADPADLAGSRPRAGRG